MVHLVREIPLDPNPEFDIRYAPEVVDEIAARGDAEDLMDEFEEVLAVHPFRPPGRRSKKIEGTDDLRRYRPHVDNDLRVFYAVEGKGGLDPRPPSPQAGLSETEHRDGTQTVLPCGGLIRDPERVAIDKRPACSSISHQVSDQDAGIHNDRQGRLAHTVTLRGAGLRPADLASDLGGVLLGRLGVLEQALVHVESVDRPPD